MNLEKLERFSNNLSQLEIHQPVLSRRNFLKAAGVITIGTLVPTACAPTSPERKPQEPTIPTTEIAPQTTKREARELLNNLPDSPYKSFAQRYAGPFLEDTTASQVDLAGLPIKVFGSSITDERNMITVSGTASILGPSQPLHKLLEEKRVTVQFPYLAKDGKTLPVGPVPIPAGTMFAEGVQPTIRILLPNAIPQSEIQTFKDVREFAILKETFSLAYMAAYIETMVQETNKAGLPLHLQNGNEKLELICALYGFIQRQNGRLTALVDVGSLILTAKVAGSQRIASSNRYHPYYARIFGDIANKEFGEEEQLLQNTINYINSNQGLIETAQKGYAGDLKRNY